MTNYIKEFQNSLTEPLCEDIIENFEKENKFYGKTIGGINKDILDSSDFVFGSDTVNWKKTFEVLHKELSQKIKVYISTLDCNTFSFTSMFNTNNFFIRKFLIKKYEKNKGKYQFHIDQLYMEDTKSKRIITFIWYLNSVEEGGGTAFKDNEIIKPTVGKLLLFPSTWTFPHSGCMPITSDKYVIVGWIED